MVATGERIGPAKTYDVARRFAEEGLGAGGSVFTPGASVWTPDAFGQLIDRFVNAQDYGKGNFEQKLRQQLADVDTSAKQLMAELLALHLLITMTVTAPKKLQIIGIPLDGLSVTVPADVVDSLDGGFVNPGAFFNTGRPNQLSFLVRAGVHIANLPADERHAILADPWRLRDVLGSIPIDGAGSQRSALLHLFFPDVFEAVVSDAHVTKIIDCFSDKIEPSDDVDRNLQAIRAALEPKYGENFDFYNARLISLWRNGNDPWDQLVKWAVKLWEDPEARERERQFKLDVAKRGAELLDALRDGTSILDAVKWLQTGSGLLDFRAADDFHQWVKANETEATYAIAALLDDTGGSVEDRIDAFDAAIAKALKTPGNRTAQASLFLMVSDPASFPIYRPSPFTTFLGLVGAKHRKSPLGRRYENAMLTCDHLIAEIAARSDVRLRDRLDAQSLIWILTTTKPDGVPIVNWSAEERAAFLAWRDGPDAQAPTPIDNEDAEAGATAGADLDDDDLLADAVRKTSLPLDFLQMMRKRLIDKGQIVCFGPPGTGKTFVARHLATAVAGSADRTALVQFHPSTTYEDFFEGIRPTTVDGAIHYDVVPGPFARLAARASADPDHRYVLIIDELNRANVPKVLGELMFLLEYRGTEAFTLYRPDSPFKLPSNLFVIATMNTVDRSVAVIDAALRRRFFFIPFFPDVPPISDVLEQVSGDEGAWIAELADALNKRLFETLKSRDQLIGPSYFIQAEQTVSGIRDIWRHAIEPTIEDHLFGQPDLMEQFRWERIAKDFADLFPIDDEVDD